ncbi:MAG: TRAP transporter substrate-binding protein [Candidatus Rokubacteria bacterium]|nr:TRAP transporter substrate-binding protein [Candidatus Rokubacteria bacterium]
MKKTLFGLWMVGALLLCLVPAQAWSQVKELSWGTAAVGSSGHRALVNLANVLNREMPNYRINVLPLPGAILTMKQYATGEIDAYYGADIGFYELANDINRFKGFKPKMKRELVQSLWTYTVEVGVGIHARDRERIRQWRDLSGQPVFTGPLPWDVRAHLERAFQVLGVKHRYVNVDLATAGSALEGRTIQAFISYTNAEATTAPWITEAGLATDWAILNPSAEELDQLKKAGFRFVEIDPKVFRRDVRVQKVLFSPFYYGFHVGLEIPERDAYRILTVVEEHAKELAKADAGFAQLAQDMVGLQRRGVESSIDLVPVHPGLARYMRERGVWDPKWDGRVAKTR